MVNPTFWSGRRVLVTGHTGFKGTWLATWLAELGAEVTGIGLAPPTEPSLFAASACRGRIDSRIGDVRAREPAGAHPRRGPARDRVPSGGTAAGPAEPAGSGGDIPEQRAGRRQPARCRAASAVAAGGRRGDQRQMLPAARPALRRGRPAGRARPLQRQQGLRRDRHRGLSGLASSPPDAGVRRRHRARRQRHRRRRFSARPAAAGPRPRASPAGQPAVLRHPEGDPALAARAGRAGRLPDAGPAARRQPGLVLDQPGTSARARSRCWTAAQRSRAAVAALRRAALASQRPGDVAIEVPTLLLSSEQARRRLGWHAPARRPSEAVAWAVEGYRALLQHGDTRWLVGQIHDYAALAPSHAERPPSRRVAPRRCRCLRLSRPTSRSSSCAAGWAPGWAMTGHAPQADARHRRQADADAHHGAATAASAFAGSCSAPAHRSEVISDYFLNFAGAQQRLHGRPGRASGSATTSRSACRTGR